MVKQKISLKAVLIALATVILIDQVFLFLGALLLQRGTLPCESVGICSIVSLVCSTAAMAFMVVKAYKQKLYAYITAVMYLIVMILGALMNEDSSMAIASGVKAAVSLFCGCLIGNCFGSLSVMNSRNRMKRH